MTTEQKRSIILLTSVLVLCGLVVFAITFFADKKESAPGESYTLSSAEKSEAKKFTNDFFKESGNYGLTGELQGFMFNSFITNPDSLTEEEYKPRSTTYETLLSNYYANNSRLPRSENFDEASYLPYSVKTEVVKVSMPNDGFYDATRTKRLSAQISLKTTITYVAMSQGYLLENGQPAPVKKYRVEAVYTDEGEIELIREPKGWRVIDVRDLDTIRILAFQDELGWTDELLTELPNPDSEKKTELEDVL